MEKEGETFLEMCPVEAEIARVYEQRGFEKDIKLAEEYQQNIERGIKIIVQILIELGIEEEIIVEQLQEKYSMTEEQARAMYEKYSNE